MRTLAVAVALMAWVAPNAVASGLKPVAPHSPSASGLRPVPPSNSAANQYVEVIPTAGGGAPATAVTRPGPTSTPAALPSQTQAALVSAGREGRRVAQLARATAPVRTHPSTPARGRAHRQSHAVAVVSGGGKGGGSSSGGATSSSAPATAVLKSLTGVDAGAGIGAGLPIALAIIALAVSAVAVRRRHAS